MSETVLPSAERQSIVLVTGLSGGGKGSILNALEDLGYEAVDNPPLTMLEEMVARSGRRLAIGVDARTRGFDAALVLATLARLRANPALRPALVYAWAEEPTLLRRYTESRRRHPLAPHGPVAEGIAAEQALTAALRQSADLTVDTTELPIASLRRLIEGHFGANHRAGRMTVSLVSFAYSHGLPREADLVFDARFLRNPHYDPILRPRTGLEPEVGAYIAADPDFPAFFRKLTDLIDILLPRFSQEGKKYATITIGCTGGRHRSVYLVERLAAHLRSRAAGEPASGGVQVGWSLHVTHRELAHEGLGAIELADHTVSDRGGGDDGADARSAPIQAQEA